MAEVLQEGEEHGAARPAMWFADTWAGAPYAKDPAVVHHQGRYLLYYSHRPDGAGRLGIGIAESHDLDSWTVIDALAPQPGCERNGIGAPGAIVLDGRVHLFYQTYGNGARDAICHAVSDDGTTFVRNPNNPVFSPTGTWNNGRAIDADVVVDGDRLLLAFATRDPEGVRQLLGLASAPLGSTYARSEWQQLSTEPMLAPELDWEQDCIEAPALCRRNGLLYCFYAGAYNNAPQQIGCAVSPDGRAWRRLSAEPLLTNGPPGSWNASESGHPFLFTDPDGGTHLFFQGNDDDGRTWYLSRLPVEWVADPSGRLGVVPLVQRPPGA